MISKKMFELGNKKSTIREIFEYGKKREAIVGVENVFDFSLGNPSVSPPDSVNQAIVEILGKYNAIDVHGYTVASGDPRVRQIIADSINKRFGVNFTKDNLFITVGAAASITICFKALVCENDEIIAFAPYFPEYKCFVEGVGAKFVVVPADITSFQINFNEFEKKINEHTKAVIVNSPNNPCGVVYNEDTIKKLSEILKTKSTEYGHPIYIIADEPYREIVYDNTYVPYIPKYYNNTLVCYSYSKSLSLPGERIGYIAVSDKVENFNEVYPAIAGSARVLGYVNAPSLFQKVIAKCVEEVSDISIYEKNRNLLYNSLIDMGYKCVKPEGAFYLFPQTLDKDSRAFCEYAKKYDLLLVPGDDFACPGHMRISYCVQTEKIERALPLFEKLAKDYLK